MTSVFPKVQNSAFNEPLASILVLSKNGEKTIADCLDGLMSQSFKDFEIILIDSGSTDKTLEIASKYPVRLVRISEHEFHHSNTRNLAVSLSKGKFVVFLVQDAFAFNEKWLENLLRPFDKEMIAATFSRQEPRKETIPLEKAFIKFTYPNDSRRFVIKQKGSGDPGSLVQLSDVSSAYRREIAHFDSTIECSEDQVIAREIMNAGYQVAYVPGSVVCHSHTYGLRSLFKRYYEMGRPSVKFVDKGFGLKYSFLYVVRLFASTLSYLVVEDDVKGRTFWIVYSIPYNALRILAYVLGHFKLKIQWIR